MAIATDFTYPVGDRNYIANGGQMTEGTPGGVIFPEHGLDPNGNPYGYVASDSTNDGYYVAQEHGEYNPDNLEYHLGEDWNGSDGGNTDLGDSVYAAANGTVIFAGNGGTGWGNVVIIEHTLADDSTVSTLYGHLDTIAVSVGQDVSINDDVGTIGTGGGLYPAHLHFEVYLGVYPGGIPGPGYTFATDPDPVNSGWVDPSNFIDNFNSPPPPPGNPDLIATNLTLGSTTWHDGDTISVNYDVTNIGATDAGNSTSNLYISTNNIITASDTLLLEDTSTGTMSPGEVNPEGEPNSFTLDLAALGLAPGTYYVGAVTDATGVVAESNENNNVSNLVQVTIPAPTINHAPVAADDTFSVQYGHTVNGSVLLNDTDPDNDLLTVDVLSSQPTALGGTVDLLANGQMQYHAPDHAPASGSATSDSFTYTIHDGQGGSDTATVTINLHTVDDYAGDTSTTGTVSVGGSSTGTIETPTDTDWFAVTLQEGHTYQFDLQGADSGNGTLADPVMQVLDSSGTPLLVSDDANGTLDSQISGFAVGSGAGGTYYISAEAFGSSGTGTYAVSVADTTPSGSPDLIATNLMLGSTTWHDGDTISVNYDVTNIGATDAGNSTSNLYISTNNIITASDTLLLEDTSTGTMSPGEVNPEGEPNSFTLDLAALGLAPGTYYVGAVTDATGVVAESNENNNVSNLVQVTVNNSQNQVQGTAGSDILIGTNGNDAIESFGGHFDIMVGLGGSDTFIFGSETTNNIREFDMITDYDASSDAIELTEGASVARQFSLATVDLVIFQGDHDILLVQESDAGTGPLTFI